QQYTSIYAGNSYQSNLPQLVMDLSSWRTIRLEFINNVVYWSYDGSNFFSMNYSGSICNINNLVIGFREAGQVDYVKIFDASNTAVYYEEFNDCNNLALAPDCVAPNVNAIASNAAYCQGDSLILTGTANVSVQYTWNGPNGFTSSLANPVLLNVTPTNSGWYKLTGYVNPCTPVNKDSVYVTVHPKKFTNVYPYICAGDSYFAGGSNQTTAGLYYDTLTTSFGCDSVVLTFLSLLSTSASANPVSICSGDSFFVAGSFQKLAGIYHDTLTNYLGCDSVITTTLSLISPVYHNISAYICQGDSLFAGGAYQHFAGIFNDTTVAASGCDSVVITNLSVIAPVNTILDVALCEGENYLAGGALQTQTGTYYDTLASILGCDSIITTNLEVIPPVSGYRLVFICENDSFLAGGSYQFAAGLYIDTLTSAAGCDSILTTDLKLILPVYTSLDAFICNGDSLLVGGNFQSMEGFYNDTLTSNSGCDSIVITHLQLIMPLYNTVTSKICLGDSLFAGGSYQNLGGSYTDTLKSGAGCDSIVTTLLEIILPVTISVDAAICYGSSYFAGGSLQTTSGTYVDTLQSAAGCDSIITTQLEVLFPVYGNKSVSICDGDYYFTGGANQTLPGNYQDTLVAANGCDSLVTTQLIVLPNPFVYLGTDTSICEGTSAQLDAGTGFSFYSWSDGSNTSTVNATEAGSYWVKVTDQEGCSGADTIIIVAVFPNPENFLPEDTAVCGKFLRTIIVPGFASYEWSNNFNTDTAQFTLPGIYTLQVTDENGCTGTDEIIFESVCEKALIMPNAFTPNGDGLNDILMPVILDELSDFELRIFNRWGKLIFYTKDPDEGWDGREIKHNAPIEQYVWTATYKNGNGEEQFEKGSVSLLR
ncbi:MAG: gliding motility-associated C-terminal domain-containing protein, partial [Chitinophagales bacterium]